MSREPITFVGEAPTPSQKMPSPEPGDLPLPGAPAYRVSRRRLILLSGILGLALAWLLLRETETPLLELNDRGAALMEQFTYDKAIAVFEEVVRREPGWLPGRINLGIALFNTPRNQANLQRAIALFQDILRHQPNNPYAHYCLGIIYQYQSNFQAAEPHFAAVTRLDPYDACAWYYRGATTEPTNAERATEYYRRALQLNPRLNSAMYALAMHLRQSEPHKAQELLDEHAALRQGVQWEDLVSAKFSYSEIGRYAEVITPNHSPRPRPAVHAPPPFQRDHSFAVHLAPGARWAVRADFGTGTVAEVRVRVRERFGGTIAVLDYNQDGKPDLFLAGAVVDKGRVRDLLLRNEGANRFVDVTAAAGLARPHPTLGCCVADFDNDGYPDLFLSGAGSQRLLRNNRSGAFEDVTTRAGLNQLTSICLGAAFVDLDQDGDLDLLIAAYAATPDEAVKLFKGEKVAPHGQIVVYVNAGEALPHSASANQPPLTCKWKRATKLTAFQDTPAPMVGLALSDVDGDHDLDALILGEGGVPALLSNERLLRFQRQKLAPTLAPAASWNGALVLDANHDGLSDLFLVAHGEQPRLLLNRAAADLSKESGGWVRGSTDAPPLLQAVAADIDLDSWTDVVGLTRQRRPVLLHNEGGRLVGYPEAAGRKEDWPGDLLALTVLTAVDGPDVLVWSESRGLELHVNRGNGMHGLQLRLTGQIKVEKGGETDRSNADGFGAWAIALAPQLWSGQENTTLAAGLAQSRQPLLLGMRHYSRADLLRLRWPDGVPQAEMNLPANAQTVVEKNRKITSCPVLFTWDGQRFVFVTDFLGAGSLGELGPDGGTRPPRSEESIKIEPEQLTARAGGLILKFADPMDEITYLDQARLEVVDHPEDVRVYPEERFASAGPPPSQELVAFRQTIFPVQARDHRGGDVTETLRSWDRRTVDGFAKRAWIGFAEEHAVELDFGDRLARVRPDERLYLCLAGWTDYAYPQSIWAAWQAGVAMQPPVLERQDDAGRWQTIAEAGFPAGLPRLMLLDVTGKLSGPSCRVRLRTNLHVYWDQIFAAVPLPRDTQLVHVNRLQVGAATLSPCGLLREVSPDGRQPTVFSHDQYETVPLNRLTGNLTRFGDVTELLRSRDDRFVIFGPGDEVTLRFEAAALPPLPLGWKRSYILRTGGYCKDTSLFTAANATVEPLPFQAMRNYPYGPNEHYPLDAAHQEYRRRFNTRKVYADRFPAR